MSRRTPRFSRGRRGFFLVALLLATLAPAALASAANTPTCAGRPATILGSAGNDELHGTIRADVIWGGGGDDYIVAGPGDDVVCGGPGNDLVRGEGGRDTILGGGGDDYLDGGSADDSVAGGPDNDTLSGGVGNDLLAGADGDDTLDGGPDADTLNAGAGRDTLTGGPGPDHLLGAEGADTLSGGDDADTLWGGPEDDSLDGGTGEDVCDGGLGYDAAAACEAVTTTEAGQVPQALTRPGPSQVALTFDDGPAGDNTRRILDILAEYDVAATFFVTGRSGAEQPELLQRMIAEGHSVQNHTYGHAWLTRYSDAGIIDQLSRANEAIETATGVRPNCLRPPYGAVSTRVRSLAEGLGLATIMWDVDPWDWKHPGPGAVASHVLRNTAGGDIVLFHDTAGWSTIGALPDIIEGLQARGLELVPICTIPGLAPRAETEAGRVEPMP